MVVDRLGGPLMMDKELRAAMDKWNKLQDEASEPLPGSEPPPAKVTKRRPTRFCPPTFVAMSAAALEKKEEEKED